MSTTRPPSDPPASKGAGFTTVATVLRETAAAAAFDRFVGSLPEETAALIRLPPSAVTWLPIEHFYALIDGAQRVLFEGDAARIVTLGYQSIQRDLNVLYRMLVRVSSVEAMLSRTARLWDTYNRNHGAIHVTMVGRNVADVRYEGIPRFAPAAFWAFQRGALPAVVEATGVRNARARILVPPDGMGGCVLRISGERDADT